MGGKVGMREGLWRHVERLKVDQFSGERILSDASTLSRSYGMSSPWVGVTLKKWAEEGRIKLRMTGSRKQRTYHIKVIDGNGVAPTEAATELTDERGPKSKKDDVLAFLRDHAVSSGHIRAGINWIARRTGMSDHDLIKILFDLRSENLVEMRTRGTGPAMEVTSLRVRPLALLSENMRNGLPEAPEGAEPEVGGTFTDPVPLAPKEVEGWPLIAKLLHRRQSITEAAKLLDEAGLEEDALALIVKADEVTPLEAEVLSLIHEMGWFQEDTTTGA